MPYFRYDDANVAGSGSGGRGGGGGGRDGGGSLVGGVIMVLFVAFIVWVIIRSNSNRGSFITVIKLQVGLLGTAKAIQKELDKIAQVADTSTRKGLSYV